MQLPYLPADVQGGPVRIDTTSMIDPLRCVMTCGAPLGITANVPRGRFISVLPIFIAPSPAITYNVSSLSAWVCSATASRTCRSELVDVPVHPICEDLNGVPREIEFFS